MFLLRLQKVQCVLKILAVKLSTNSPFGIGVCVNPAQVGTIWRFPLFSEITEDLRPITLYTEYCKEVSGGGWNIL